MDEQFSRERVEQREQKAAADSSQDQESGQAGAKPNPHGAERGTGQESEGKPAANAAESGPADQRTGEGTGARAGEYS
jgi:hypothetical protein